MTAVRLTLAYMGVLFVFAVAITTYVTFSTAALVQKQARDGIDEEMQDLASIYATQRLPGLIRAVERRAKAPGANLYLIANPDGTIVGGNVGNVERAVMTNVGWTEQPFEYGRFGARGMERSEALARVVTLLPSRLKLLIGRDVGESKRFRDIVRRTLAIAGLSILGIGLAAWLLVGRRALKRIDSVARSSRRIMAGDLSQRIPLSGAGDEFDRLSENLNALLGRIERLDAGLKQVSDNIAHDLRTPLARIRTRAEEALVSGEERAALSTIIQDSDRLIETFNALLMISRTEAGGQTAAFETLDLPAIAADVYELYEPVAEEQGVRLAIEADGDVAVRGNRQLLGQALANLIENALTHSQGSELSVRVSREDGRAVLAVADNGMGIPKEERARVLERFYRRDAARTDAGSGLGLALVKAIANLHDAELDLTDNGPGLVVTLRFPA